MILARRGLRSQWLATRLRTVRRREPVLGRAEAGPTFRPLRLPSPGWTGCLARVASRGESLPGAECERMFSSQGCPPGGKDRKGIR